MQTSKIMKIRNEQGLSFEFLETGSVCSIEAGQTRINLKHTSIFSEPGTNIFLRKRTGNIACKPILGSGSDSLFKAGSVGFSAAGEWEFIAYECILTLSENSTSWKWTIDIANRSAGAIELDLVHFQGAGLKPATNGLVNEYYVSQYLERRILDDKDHGAVICCRQNMRERSGNAWLMMFSADRAASASTDGMQFYGKSYRGSEIPEGLLSDNLGGEYSGESSVLAIQEKPFTLGPGENHRVSFITTFIEDHPQATSVHDLKKIPGLILEFSGHNEPGLIPLTVNPVRTIYSSVRHYPACELTDQELRQYFSSERRFPDIANGKLLSFFYGENNHVMLRAKELLADRPHGHILQANTGCVPDEGIISTTAWAGGIFNSHLTQGNTNFNTFLSVSTSQFNLSPETGQRIIIESKGKKYLLGVPSAFEMGLNYCRWIYKHDDQLLQVRTWTSQNSPRVNMDFKVLSGENVNLQITHDFDPLNDWHVAEGTEKGVFVAKPHPQSMINERFPGAQFRIIVNSRDQQFRICGDEVLFEDGMKRGSSLFVLDVRDTAAFFISIIGELISPAHPGSAMSADEQWSVEVEDAQSAWKDLSLKLSLSGGGDDISAIREILPWYGMNALTHFLTPYGLEQFSGAAWGTRDVAQGPFDLLLCMEKYAEASKVLQIIFSNQNADGGWPQWWMFDSYCEVRADSSHGDIFYWCIIALCNYVKVTGDLAILEMMLPYSHDKENERVEKTSLKEHIDRLVRMITDSFIPGTFLVPFGGGDWNDSLQPVSKDLAKRMISSWTVEMNYQAFIQLAEVYDHAGEDARANDIRETCTGIKADFNRYLIRDSVVAGYGLLEEDGNISLLLHPYDTRTGIRFSILPMERGILSGIFTSEQASHHQDLIDKHLKGPDGARLMDHPLRYRGGIQTIFQRAESSTFFGREIGLMYVHEHIRYAESLARTGKADAFVMALRQANPVGYRDIVTCGDIRQSNCYYSSSDVAFRNRYEADVKYDEIMTGKITLRGGWRVYSSGPGIYLAIVITRFLGIRVEAGKIILDPVIPRSMEGLTASMILHGHQVSFKYLTKEGSFSPKNIAVNGKQVVFRYEENPYRPGGAIIEKEEFLSLLDQQENTVEIFL